MIKKVIVGIVLSVGLMVTTSSTVLANHSWGGYHWARTVNPFTLVAADNLTSSWKSFLATTINDWSQSAILDLNSVAGVNNPKRCKPTLGRDEVCNSAYGKNGWLGIAQIWTNGLHIVQGVTKVNDSYMAKAPYNTSAWKNLVLCQEVGHTLGLDHQDEDFNNANLGTCMDYTSDPSTNQHPNQHDYDELAVIYQHLDDTTTVAQTAPNWRAVGLSEDDPAEWGKLIRKQGRSAVYERDFGFWQKLFTFVILAD